MNCDFFGYYQSIIPGNITLYDTMPQFTPFLISALVQSHGFCEWEVIKSVYPKLLIWWSQFVMNKKVSLILLGFFKREKIKSGSH